MDSSVSPKDEIWFLRMCHHISNAVFLMMAETHPSKQMNIQIGMVLYHLGVENRYFV
jgi:hypothetical protein